MDSKLKNCGRCGIPQELSNFSKRTRTAGIYKQHWCKKCMREYTKQKRDEAASYEGRQRDKYLRTKYDLTLEEYNKRVEDQEGVCAICKDVKRSLGGTRLCVDHDHTRTRRVRDLLCSKCNLALGLMEDNTEWLEEMLKYISKHNAVAEKELENEPSIPTELFILDLPEKTLKRLAEIEKDYGPGPDSY